MSTEDYRLVEFDVVAHGTYVRKSFAASWARNHCDPILDLPEVQLRVEHEFWRLLVAPGTRAWMAVGADHHDVFAGWAAWHPKLGLLYAYVKRRARHEGIGHWLVATASGQSWEGDPMPVRFWTRKAARAAARGVRIYHRPPQVDDDTGTEDQ